MKLSYANQWAFIMGASSGIGYALTEQLLERKAQVVLFARNEDRLERAKNQLQNKFPNASIKTKAVDVSDYHALLSCFRQLSIQKIEPYFLFNCVGRAIPKRFEEIHQEQLQDTFRLNVLSAWNSIQVALPYMKKNGGYIMNISSVAGFVGVYGYADYSMSKFGIIGLSEVLRSELEPFQIHVSVLCPPDTDTPGFQNENKTKPEETLAVSAHAQLMSPEAVAFQTLNLLRKNRFIILVNLESKLTWFLKRFFPRFLYYFIQKDIRKIQNKQK